MPDVDPLTAAINGSSPPTSINALAEHYALENGVDPELGRRLIRQESGGRSRAVSPKGARGLMQLMPDTARHLGVTDPFDVHQNLNAGMKYLRQQLDTFGDPDLALAAYNAGPGAVLKHGNKIPPYKETQNYVKSIGAGYTGNGYVQDPLTAITQGRTIEQVDPLMSATQRDETPAPTPAQPTPLSISAEDRLWHAGVTPEEYKTLKMGQRQRINQLVIAGKQSDEAKRSAGQLEFTQDVGYQNQVRQAAGLKPIDMPQRATPAQLAPPPGKAVDTSVLAKPAEPDLRTGLGIAPPVAESLGANILPKADARDSLRPQVEAKVREENQYQPAIGDASKVEGPRGQILTPQQAEAEMNSEIDRRTADLAEQQDWQSIHQREIDQKAETLRTEIRKQSGPMKWLTEVGSQGAAGLMRIASGAVRKGGQATGLLTGGADVTDAGADDLRIAAAAAQQAALAEGADRNAVSRWGQHVMAGLVSSAPAMAAMSAGVPAPLAFAGQGVLESAGSGGSNQEQLKAGVEGAKQGLAWEVPGVVKMIKRPVLSATAKGAQVGVLTGSAAAGEGKSLPEVLESGLTNAVMAGGGQLLHGAPPTESSLSGIVKTPIEPEPVPETPTIPESQQNALRASFLSNELAPAVTRPLPENLPAPNTEMQAPATRVGRMQEIKQGQNAPQLQDIPGPQIEVQAEGAKLNRWQHRDFGLVTESENQSGVGDGRVRVLDEQGIEHVIKRSKGTGAGNQIAVPIREAKAPELSEEEQAKADEANGFKVIDKRGQPWVAFDPDQIISMKSDKPNLSEGGPQNVDSAISQREIPLAKEAATQVGTPEAVRVAPTPELKERSFPKTLATSGREGGTDLTYQAITDEESRTEAERIADEQGTDKAIETFKADKGSATKTALGIELIDRLQKEAADHETNGNKEDAAIKYAQAADVASHAAERLTTAGQEIQAASIAQRYSPEGALREAARIAKIADVPLTPEQTKTTIEISKRVQESEQRLAQLEQTVATLRKGTTPQAGSSNPSRAPRLEKIDVYFSRLEQEARARLEARTGVDKGSESGASTIPLDIADYAIIGAAKLAKGGITFAKWSAYMVKEFGEDVKPHLDKIFLASRNLIDEQKAQNKTAQLDRSAMRIQRSGETLQDALQRLNAERATNRQMKSDLDRHFRQLQRDQEGHALNAVISLSRDSLLSVRGILRILGGMGGKQALDFSSRFVKAGVDEVQSRITDGPRTTAAPSFGTVLRTVGGFLERAPSSVKSAVRGEPSEVMPSAHGGPTDNPYINVTVGIMQRLYGGKEALIRSWAYPEAQQSNARVFALNDFRDGLIKYGEKDSRTKDYIAGRVEFEGVRNKKLAESLAKQAADYEARNKQIIPSMKDVRVKEMVQSPTELLHSMAMQATDKAVYAQPYETKIAQKLGSVGTDTVGGKIVRGIILPFAKRPANNVADSLFGYTGLKTLPEGGRLVRDAINGEFNPAQVKAFNDAVGKGASGFAVMAIGAVLAKKGVLVSPLDKNHPGAIKIGGSYYNVSNVPIIGWLLGMGATYQHDGAKNVPRAFAKMIAEHPALRAAKEMYETVDEWTKQGFGKASTKFIANIIARLIPAPVKIAAEASDTKERVSDGITGPTRASIPGVRQRLIPYADKNRLSVLNPLYSKPREPKRGTAMRVNLN